MTSRLVPMNDFRRLPADRMRTLEEAVQTVLRSGWYVLGTQVADFEKDWAGFCGTRHAVGVGNGMDAIEIGLRALGLGPNDEVITTPMTAFATVLGIMRAGAVPVLADIDPETGLLDPASVERCLGPRTRALLVVHLYGQMRRMDVWQRLCAAHHLILLEDAAQAHGAEWQGRKAGSFGQWAAYSFYPTKNLGAVGDGGALCTNDDAVARQAMALRNYGQSDRYHHPVAGLNSRLDEIQAALLRSALTHLASDNRRRQDIAARYAGALQSSRVHPLAPPEVRSAHVYHLFVVRTSARAELQAHLQKHEVQSLVHYPVCVHRQPPGANLRRDPLGVPAAETFANECLSLPCQPFLTDEEVERVIAAVNSF
ncbi:MAG TPA: DegT/DnrJ/EryC1/StrS family aminotransferase [Candidatus Didemnitutus sp.]|nr:DegT/DnrJ/EryC1/StrS family aminotransferase [Candidatus Didemnitutus sp.]